MNSIQKSLGITIYDSISEKEYFTTGFGNSSEYDGEEFADLLFQNCSHTFLVSFLNRIEQLKGWTNKKAKV